jgi:hypothetical protein
MWMTGWIRCRQPSFQLGRCRPNSVVVARELLLGVVVEILGCWGPQCLVMVPVGPGGVSGPRPPQRNPVDNSQSLVAVEIIA